MAVDAGGRSPTITQTRINTVNLYLATGTHVYAAAIREARAGA